MEAENTHQVFDWLWTSGQLTKGDILALPELGIEAVVNLALPTSSNALPGEAELVTGLGMTYIQIPVEWEAPREEDLLLLVGILSALDKKKIWLHCARNMRVSAFVYLYRRMTLGEDELAARRLMDLVWQPDPVWQSFIQETLAKHLPRLPLPKGGSQGGNRPSL